MVRKEIGFTQEKFSSLIGITRPHLARIEIGDTPLTKEIRNKISNATGAWIELQNDGRPEPPVGHVRTATEGDPFDSENGEELSFSKEHWKIWSALGEGNELGAFHSDWCLVLWLHILITSSRRRKKYRNVRTEIISFLESLAKSYELEPTIQEILKTYEPVWKREVSTTVMSVTQGFKGLKERPWKPLKWNPYKHIPSWFKNAVALTPLAIHSAQPDNQSDFGKHLESKSSELLKKFRELESKPQKALEFAKEENFPAELIQLAEAAINGPPRRMTLID